jgi:hypothetical protein
VSTIDLMGKKAASLFCLCFLFSCAEVRLKTPSARFMSPETSGKEMAIGGQYFQQSGTEAKVELQANELDKVELRNHISPMALNIYLGLKENIDVFLYNYMDSASLLGVKYQIFGQSRKKAKAGDKSLAVTLGGGSQSRTTTESNIFSDEVDKTELEQTLIDASIIYGQRVTDQLLVYTSFQISNHTADLTIKSNDDPALDGQSELYETTNYGLSLGAKLYNKNKGFHISAEASAQRVDWTYTDPKTFAFISGAIGLDF